MSSHEVSPRNRAERRLAAKKGKRAQAVGAALTAGTAALAMGASWIGPGVQAAGAATTLHVTTTNDTGVGSLRAQVAAASSGDTIDFQVTGAITLTTGRIAFNKDLTFTGPGASALTISGNDASQIFYVTGGSAVTISGLTLAHASHASSNGGAIETDGSLTLTNDVFDHNVSTDDGGAAVVGGELTVTNSTFTNNSADDWGGAIFVHGADVPVSITGSTFSGNDAGDAGGGFAIQDKSSVTIDSTTVTGNTAEHGGGIEFFENNSQAVSNSTISGNHATKGNGGGIDSYSSGGISITSSTLATNDSTDLGGGVNLYEVDGQVSIAGTSITGNTSGDGGGGVYGAFLYQGVDISNSTISGNSSDAWGGGLYLGYTYSFVNVTNTTISGNHAAEGGGGAQVFGANNEQTVSVIDSTISGNTAADGGGGGWIQWAVGGPTTFANSTISGNTTSAQGGGLYFYGSYGLSVDMSTITDNHAGESTGGVFLYAGNDLKSAGSGGHHARSAAAVASTQGGGDDTPSGPKAHKSADGGKAHATAVLAQGDITGSIVWGNSGNDVGEVANVTFSHSLLGTVASGIVQTDAGGNLTGVDPLLGPLQNNGGATETHALLPGSPAKDTGPDPVPDFAGNEFDQRGAGFARVVDGRSDIGAFEVQPPVAAPEAVVITPKFTG